MDDLKQHYIQVNGIRIHYVSAGNGPVLMLLHGFPEFWYSWRKQIDALKQHYTVVAPDLRGYNETDKPNWGYETDVLTADVVGLIDALGAKDVYLAGHDWGGIIAWSVAIAYPHRLKKLAILNAPHPTRFIEELSTNPRQMLRSWYAACFQLPWLPELVLSANNYAGIEQLFRRTARRQDAFSDQDIARYKAAISKPGSLTAAINWYRRAAIGMLPQLLGKEDASSQHVSVPTLLIWGEEDDALGKELTYDTERYAPDLEIHYLPGCSHWVQQECPDQVNKLLGEFFSSS